MSFAQHRLWEFWVCSRTLSSDLHHSQSAARPGSTQLAPLPTHGWWVMFLLQHSPPSHRGLGCTGPIQALLGTLSPSGMDRQEILLRQGDWNNLLQGLMALSWFSCCPCSPPPPPALWCAGVEAARASRELTGAILGGPTGSDWSNWGTSQPPPE